MTLSPKTWRIVKKVIPYTVIWVTAALIYILLERGLLGQSQYYPSNGNIYNFHTSLIVIFFSSLIMGVTFGILEETIGKAAFKKRSFGVKLILKTFMYVATIVIFLTVISLINGSIELKVSLLHPNNLNSFYAFIGDFVFWSIVMYIGFCILFTLFVAEMVDNLGIHAISNFLFGRYHKPKIEERIFMFLDMKSSTTIAEQLGHVLYYKLLNNYYSDMTDAIIETRGEIYQYVGDEIVVSWDVQDGLTNQHCIDCFFRIKDQINGNAKRYNDAYGLVPAFKAGIHLGQVTTGEIGVIKKDILFTGDVLNTTARIQGTCNDLKTELLISEDLVKRLDLNGRYDLLDMGQFELRGKDRKMELFSIKPI